MTTLKINDKEYKIKFGYNSFCDTDLMDRTQDLIMLFANNNVESDEDVKVMGKIKDLFVCVRELLFVGFKKFNPVDTVQDVGDLLDDYKDEATEEENRGLISLFTLLSEELMSEGFFADLMKALSDNQEETAQKKPTKRK